MGIYFWLLTLAVASGNMASADKDTKYKEMVEQASKTIMLTYNKNDANRSVSDIEEDIKKICSDCQITRLDAAGALIVTFKDANHPPASDFKSIAGILSAADDSVNQLID